MSEALLYLVSSFWLGAVHAATPGHGKTIAAAYIVGARGRPVDAIVLGVFVTLSHTSGIVIVGLLASMGLPGMMPQRIEAWLAVATGILIIAIGLWTLWTQRDLVVALQAMKRQPEAQAGSMSYVAAGGGPSMVAQAAHAHSHAHSHSHTHDHAHGHHHHGDHHHDHEHGAGMHSHGWGFKHTHDLSLVTRENRPSMAMLIALGVAGGILPDPAALAILFNALAQGKVMLGLGTVVVFSVGFAATLTVVGVIAAKIGKRILDWLSGPWAIRIQLATSLLIVIVGVVLTFNAIMTLRSLAAA